jgi:hypothetical protein
MAEFDFPYGIVEMAPTESKRKSES